MATVPSTSKDANHHSRQHETEANMHYPKGYVAAAQNAFMGVDETDALIWEQRYFLPAALNYVSAVSAPPTEVGGDIYVLSDAVGAVHADWDGCAKDDWVRYNTAADLWYPITPLEGFVFFNKTDNALYSYDGSTWNASGGAGTVTSVSGIANRITSTGGAAPVIDISATFEALLEKVANKDASGGYAGLTALKINFKNVANTFISFFTNTNTAARTYTFKDADGTIAFTSDITGTNSGTNTGDETAARIGALINGSSAATPNDADLVATAESSVLKKITWTNVKTFLKTYFDAIYQAILTAANVHTFVDSLTGMTTPVDADRMIIVDNSASLAKKITWANLKATLWGTTTTMTAAINEKQGADIASAGTTDIGAATGNFIHVTGTTTITALGTVQAGTRRIVKFTGALTLTHNATSLILPGSANILTVAGDTAEFISLGSGNWICVCYQPVSNTYNILSPVKRTVTISHTGTTAETKIFSQKINAGTFKANDIFYWFMQIGATVNANNKVYKVYFNDSDDISSSPTQVATYTLTNAGLIVMFDRHMIFKNAVGTQEIISSTTSIANYLTPSTSAHSTPAIDFTVDQYFCVSVALANAADTAYIHAIKSDIHR